MADFTLETDLGYVYPLTSDDKLLDFSPTSDLHRALLTRLNDMAGASKAAMSSRYPVWNQLDRNLQAYVVKDSDEVEELAFDERRPMSIVIPLSYAILETILTYFGEVFLQDAMFPYDGVGPEDTMGAILLQHIVQQQCLYSGVDLALHTQWRDGLVYGFGAVSPTWSQHYGNKVVNTNADPFAPPAATKTLQEDQLLWEGATVTNIDPYNYLPDPNTPIHDVQNAEFIGQLSTDNRMNLLTRELDKTEGLFNVRYLDIVRERSALIADESGRYDNPDTTLDPSGGQSDHVTNPVDLLHMYVSLVPEEWGLGNGTRPEKWEFIVANDNLIVKANKSYLNHDLFPVVTCVPDFDGYSLSPTSRMEVIYGAQKTADWLMSNRIANLRKMQNDVLIVDPGLMRMDDILKRRGKAGAIYRTARTRWGQGVEGGIKQFVVNDTTANHLRDIQLLIDLMQRVSGATDALQGVFDAGAPERRTATEYSGTTKSATARLSKAARNIQAMSMRPLGRQLAALTQQFLSRETYARVTGTWEEVLRVEYGLSVQRGRVAVNPNDLDVNFDISPLIAGVPSGEDDQLMFKLFQLASGHPELSQAFDLRRMYMSMARRAGEKGMDNFIRYEPAKVQVLPDEQVQEQAASGKVVPVGK